jgi:hypothetical protein
MYPSTAVVPSLAFAIGDTMYTVRPSTRSPSNLIENLQLNAADFPYGDAEDGFVFGGVQSRGTNPFDVRSSFHTQSID